LRTIEFGIKGGKYILLENIGEDLDPLLEPILLQNVVKKGGALILKLGDKEVPYHEDFRFFLTTTLPNPH